MAPAEPSDGADGSLEQGSLDHERAVLESYGNMSAAYRAFRAGAYHSGRLAFTNPSH
jgi:hypothetical protein